MPVSRLGESKMRPAGCRSPLILVFAIQTRRAIRLLGRAGELRHRKLADPHAGPQQDGQVSVIRQLQRQAAAKPRVDIACVLCTIKPSRPSELLPSIRPTRSSGIWMVSTVPAEYELAGMQDEARAVRDLNRFGQVWLIAHGIDVRLGLVDEHPKHRSQAQVDARWLNGGCVKRGDVQAA